MSHILGIVFQQAQDPVLHYCTGFNLPPLPAVFVSKETGAAFRRYLTAGEKHKRGGKPFNGILVISERRGFQRSGRHLPAQRISLLPQQDEIRGLVIIYLLYMPVKGSLILLQNTCRDKPAAGLS